MSSIGKKFSFTSSALPDDAFEVVSFTGTEGLSKLYRFDVTLVSANDDIDLESVIQSRARLTILRDNGNIAFNGLLAEFEQLETALGRTHYRAVLTPAFWRQTLTHHNQIFLDKTIPEIIEAAMKDGGLTSLDYEFRLTGSYPLHEYVCQYNESHYSFISRLMEREGLYYYFEQGRGSEKLVITDTALQHSVMEEGEKLFYSPPSGLDETSREEVIKALLCCQKMLPARVVLKDYNYRKPSLELTAEHAVSGRGIGDVFIYGEHFATPEEGARLAKVRAEALICRARMYQGESLIPYLRPGYIFRLEGHNRKDFNVSYLTTDITHNGDQTFLFTAGLDEVMSGREKSSYYRNSFTAITSDCQFRPERTTEKPRISGTLNAHIDAEGSGEYAEIDSQGRYKVLLPFDMSSSKGGKASSWLRMAQPYAGDNHGMHFPLHKGTEVLLTFIDGDPDRPIISAAVPNPLTPSPVTSENSTQSRITTAGNNKIHLEDKAGSERIVLHTPKQNTWLRMGTPNDPPAASSGDGEEKKKVELEYNKSDGFKLFTAGDYEIEAINERKILAGFVTDIVGGVETSIVGGARNHITLIDLNELTIGLKMAVQLAFGFEYAPEKFMATTNKTEMHAINAEIHGMNTEIAENRNAIAATNLAINDVNTRVTQANTQIGQVANTVAQNTNDIVQAQNTLAQESARLTQVNQHLTQQTTQLSQQTMQLSQQTTHLAQQTTNLATQTTNLNTQVSNLCDAVVDLQETQTVIATSIQML